VVIARDDNFGLCRDRTHKYRVVIRVGDDGGIGAEVMVWASAAYSIASSSDDVLCWARSQANLVRLSTSRNSASNASFVREYLLPSVETHRLRT
jgi:hypothetical protein